MAAFTPLTVQADELVALLQRAAGPRSMADEICTLIRRFKPEHYPAGAPGGKGGQFMPTKAGSGGGGKGKHGKVRTALADAVSTDALDQAAGAEARRITGRDITFTFTGSDVQLAKEHAEGILRGLERYPNVGLRRVEMGDVRDGDGEAFAATSQDGRRITFNHDSQVYGAASYRQDVRQEHASHFHVSRDPMGIAMHEFGHAVANHYTLNGWARNTAETYASNHGHEVDTDEELAQVVSREISRYAATSQRELAAEAIGDVLANGDKARPMSQAIVKVVDRDVQSADMPDEDGE